MCRNIKTLANFEPPEERRKAHERALKRFGPRAFPNPPPPPPPRA
jgi:hypothetical protein